MIISQTIIKKIVIGLILGGFIGIGMVHTPLDDQSALWSLLVMTIGGLALLVYVYFKYGPKPTIGIVIIMFLGVTIEFIGITTCIPYGCFSYSHLVGPRFMGTFPLSLLFVWPVIVVTVLQLVPQHKNIFINALIGGICLMGLDIFLDPVAVHQGLRMYELGVDQFHRYGVPLSNYLGRIATGTLSSFIIYKFSPQIVGDTVLQYIGLVIVGMYVSGFLSLAFI